MSNTKAREGSSCSVDLINASKSKTPEASNSSKKIDDEKSKSIEDSEKGEDISTPLDKKETSGFNGFGFNEIILKTIKEKGYKEPSPIQKAAIPEILLGRDLVGQAQTGTGKTAAFALPLIERLENKGVHPEVLVLTPTRELAMQVADSFRAYALGHKNLKVIPIYGGSDFRYQIKELKKGISVVVGTPGRVMDHMRQGTLHVGELKTLVLDEADEMLRMGFIDDVEWVLEQLPDNRQMVLFSATMPPEIRRLSKRYLNDPAEITIKSKEKEAKLIKQNYITVQNSFKLEALKRVLEIAHGKGVIIFARTKVITLNLSEALEASGHQVSVLNGDVPQTQRERTVERLRGGGINVLVATDVAARGLDVERVELVINYDMPFDSEAYVHRIGRTGRAGRKGEAILFVNPRERRFLGNLERAVGQNIDLMEIPTNDQINKSRLNKLKENIIRSANIGREHENETELLKELIQTLQTEENLNAEDIAFATINLLVGFTPLLAQGKEDWLKNIPVKSRVRDRRDERTGSRRRNDRDQSIPENNMERFRVEVGHKDRVKPGNLVGAIANETGLNGKMIGRIQIFDNFSFIDLPKGMPPNVLKELKKVKVMNKELRINRKSP